MGAHLVGGRSIPLRSKDRRFLEGFSMKHANLTAEPRTVLGKKVARLRRSGKLPANIYGRNVPSTAITLDAHDFDLLYRHLLPTTVIDLRVDGQMRPVLLAKADVNPRTGRLVHLEFKQVNLREKVQASVPVVGVGRSELRPVAKPSCCNRSTPSR